MDQSAVPCSSVVCGSLTHWDRVTHICISKLAFIASDNGLSPGRRHAIIWINAGILLLGSLGTNFNDIAIEIHIFSFKKTHFKMSSGQSRPFCLGLNVLTHWGRVTHTFVSKLRHDCIDYALSHVRHQIIVNCTNGNIFQRNLHQK